MHKTKTMALVCEWLIITKPYSVYALKTWHHFYYATTSNSYLQHLKINKNHIQHSWKLYKQVQKLRKHKYLLFIAIGRKGVLNSIPYFLSTLYSGRARISINTNYAIQVSNMLTYMLEKTLAEPHNYPFWQITLIRFYLNEDELLYICKWRIIFKYIKI